MPTLTVFHHKGKVENGTEFAYFLLDPPKRDFKYTCKADFVVSIVHVSGPKGQMSIELGYVLNSLIINVEGIVNKFKIAKSER